MTRRTAALAVLGLTASLATPAAAQATTLTPATPPAAQAPTATSATSGAAAPVEQVVARVVADGRTTLESFPVDEHGSVAAARRAALATPGVQEVAAPVAVRAMGTVGSLTAGTADTAAAGYVDGWARRYQWHVDRLGSETLPAATSAATGVLVAVLDTGVRADHEDWASGTVRCDLGADFSDRSRPTTSVGNGCTDANGHGTHVAGLVAAARGNGLGVAGLSQAQVLPVKVLGDDGSGTDVSAAAGIYWAVDRGADVVSMSLGGSSPGAHYDNAVAYAKARGVPVVASAGNNRQTGNLPNYPAAFPDVISVAATGTDDRSTSFSYSGPTNDLAAPGAGIVSLGRSSRTSYVGYSGTSQAAPLVSAVAAMWLAQHPGATVAQVTAALVGSARDLEEAGPDPKTGAGLVDPVRLLAPSAPVEQPSESPAPAPAPPPATTPVQAPVQTPPAQRAPVVRPPVARPAPVAPGLALPKGSVRRGAMLKVTAGRMAPRSLVTVTARYAQTVRVRVRGKLVTRSVVRPVVLRRARTDSTGTLVLPVVLPKAASRVRLVVTGTRPGGRPALAQSIVTAR